MKRACLFLLSISIYFYSDYFLTNINVFIIMLYVLHKIAKHASSRWSNFLSKYSQITLNYLSPWGPKLATTPKCSKTRICYRRNILTCNMVIFCLFNMCFNVKMYWNKGYNTRKYNACSIILSKASPFTYLHIPSLNNNKPKLKRYFIVSIQSWQIKQKDIFIWSFESIKLYNILKF